nr:hypothetical protein [Tanacetum cinerariifolium]
MEEKGSGGSKQTLAKNPDAPVTKVELGNEIKRIMSEHLPTILAQSQENFWKAEEAKKATKEVKKKKKENEEAERRRKAMEDKRAADEQERKRKAEQDRKNAKDAQRLRNEEAERRRRNAEAQGDECSYKGKYASRLLKGEARHWQNMIKIARGDDVASVMTWEEFEDLVMENYCPRGLMDKIEEELLKLQQNDMTVQKCTAKFNKKASFVKYQKENPDDDMKKIMIIGEKTDNASEYKQCTICKKPYRERCWHEDCRNYGKPGHATNDCKGDWVCFRCKKPRHKIVDCPESKPQDPQEKTGYSGNRVEYKDTQQKKTIGRVFQLTAEKISDTPY